MSSANTLSAFAAAAVLTWRRLSMITLVPHFGHEKPNFLLVILPSSTE
jgi:hypothetical protein